MPSVSQIRRGLPPLPRKLSKLTDDLSYIPPGYGFRTLKAGELLERAQAGDLLEVFQVWEPPLRGARYVLGVDVGEGLGQDRSVVDVLRLPTLARGEEQVAQYISDAVKPSELAFVIDAIGRYYCDDDGLEALAAIETNNCGLSTQDTLQLHLGYRHFYRWEVFDSINPSERFTKRIGWYTTPKSRPILLDYLHEALTTVDPLTGVTDLKVNSLWTIEDLSDFQTQTTLREAEAAAGAHDDCVMSLAIAHLVAWRLAGGEIEPLAERRRRRHAMEERARRLAGDQAAARDFRNMAYTEQEAETWSDRREAGDPDRDEDELEAVHDVSDPRGIIYDDEYSGY